MAYSQGSGCGLWLGIRVWLQWPKARLLVDYPTASREAALLASFQAQDPGLRVQP